MLLVLKSYPRPIPYETIDAISSKLRLIRGNQIKKQDIYINTCQSITPISTITSSEEQGLVWHQ